MTTIEARIVLNSAKLAVARYNHNNGKNYKSAIRQAWYDGNYRTVGLDDLSGQLQRIRNQFGPSWLIKAQPMTPDQSPDFVADPSAIGNQDSTPYVL